MPRPALILSSSNRLVSNFWKWVRKRRSKQVPNKWKRKLKLSNSLSNIQDNRGHSEEVVRVNCPGSSPLFGIENWPKKLYLGIRNEKFVTANGRSATKADGGSERQYERPGMTSGCPGEQAWRPEWGPGDTQLEVSGKLRMKHTHFDGKTFWNDYLLHFELRAEIEGDDFCVARCTDGRVAATFTGGAMWIWSAFWTHWVAVWSGSFEAWFPFSVEG